MFCGKHHLRRAVITTIDISDFRNINNTEYEFIPASLYSYTVGKNIVLGLQMGFFR